MADNVTLSAGTGGATVRTISDSGGVEWPASVICFATSTTPGAGAFTFVGSTAGLPVAQQGTWNVGVTGSVAVTGTFFQATQPVSGTFWQATQPVSGTVGVTQSGSWTVTVVDSVALNVSAAQAGSWTVGVTGSVAVTGTFFQATQPVSGTFFQTTQPVSGTFWQTTQPVSIAASVTVAQATAASLNATVVGTGTFAVQAAQSGTWNVGTVTTVSTVTAVTAITNALPAGTNLLGSIAESPQIGTAYNGTTAATVQYASFSTSSSGATTIVAAVSGKKIYVLRWSVSSNGATNVNLQSHTTTTNATGTRYLTQYAGAGGAYCPLGIMATTAGEALDINNSAAIAISGELTYCQF
jgi:hypothetical protein